MLFGPFRRRSIPTFSRCLCVRVVLGVVLIVGEVVKQRRSLTSEVLRASHLLRPSLLKLGRRRKLVDELEPHNITVVIFPHLPVLHLPASLLLLRILRSGDDETILALELFLDGLDGEGEGLVSVVVFDYASFSDGPALARHLLFRGFASHVAITQPTVRGFGFGGGERLSFYKRRESE